jgi:predicted P-loop ATPase
MTPVFQEAKRLYDFGFAVHWLHPESKIPKGKGWAKGERKSWKELSHQYQAGMNSGVRLGKPSEIQIDDDHYFLAVIDGDCKSQDLRHRTEMEEKIRELFPSVGPTSPRVATGRGNGSVHIYFLSRFPLDGGTLTQSSEVVKVHAPSSVIPSKRELEALTEEELASGVRLKAAWEVSLMAENRQVVAPYSVHPDTKNLYMWQYPLESIGDLPVVEFSREMMAMKKSKSQKNAESFKPAAIGIGDPRLTEPLRALIMSGDGGTGDRSVDVFNACKDLVRCGLSDNEIATLLTDRGTFLGEVGYDHTKSDERGRAAGWITNYSIGKARLAASCAKDFENEVVIEELEDEAAVALQKLELCGEPKDTWRNQIERGGEKSGFKPKNTLANTVLILRGEFGPDLFRENLFTRKELYGMDPPWGGQKGAEIRDLDILFIKKWLIDNHRFEPSNDRIYEAVRLLASENSFHPVRDYLETLVWDGKPRIDTWIKDYMQGTAPEPYLSHVSAKTLVALVARAYEPGVKYDQVLILQGDQGVGKSTSLRFLVGDEWFSDAHMDISDKDAVLNIAGRWLVELGELRSMNHADVNLLKEFVSRQTDRLRVPYGRKTEDFPRQCVFVGTTNAETFLKDNTGNRRFWPINVGACNFEAIARDRDQLFAEAKFAYDLGEKLFLEDALALAQAGTEQDARMPHDSWIELLEGFFERERAKDEDDETRFNVEAVQVGQLFAVGGPLAAWRENRAEQMRAVDALRAMGFKRWYRTDPRTGHRKWVYSKDKSDSGRKTEE